MALVTTFATTPLTAWLYPPWYQRKLEAWKRGIIEWDTGAPLGDGSSEADADSVRAQKLLRKSRICLFTSPSEFVEKKHPTHKKESPEIESLQMPFKKRPVEVHAVTEVDEYSMFDPVLNALRVLGQLCNLTASGEVAVVPAHLYADTLVTRAVEESSDLLLLPWSETGSMSEAQTISSDSTQNKLSSDAYSSFIARALETAQCNTAVFINKGFSGSLKQRPSALDRKMSTLSVRSQRERMMMLSNVGRSHHVFLPFFGGAHGKMAVRLLLQLCENPEVTATIVHFRIRENSVESSEGFIEQTAVTPKGAQARSGQHENDAAFFASMQRSLQAELEGRVVSDSSATTSPLADAVATAQEEVGQDPENGGDLIVLGAHTALASNVAAYNGCLAITTDNIVESGVRASVLVVQARGSGLD